MPKVISFLKPLALSFSLAMPLTLTGCMSTQLADYQATTPTLDLFDYFEGKTEAWGQFQTRSGEVVRKFKVDITGTIDGDTLTLDEQFVYNDGTTDERIWTITRTAPNTFVGTASDVIGQATGQQAGSAFTWSYEMDLPYKGDTVKVRFDDWMYLHSEGKMINRAKVTKFGVEVGEVTLFFSK